MVGSMFAVILCWWVPLWLCFYPPKQNHHTHDTHRSRITKTTKITARRAPGYAPGVRQVCARCASASVGTMFVVILCWWVPLWLCFCFGGCHFGGCSDCMGVLLFWGGYFGFAARALAANLAHTWRTPGAHLAHTLAHALL